MRPVVQEERTGCGIAAVATLAGVTYAEARRAALQLGIAASDPLLWSDQSHVRRLLARYRIHPAPRETPFRSWEALPSVALLAIKWHRVKGRAFWHWVVFHRGPDRPVVLDSKRSLRVHRRTDFGRMKPKWFLPVILPWLRRSTPALLMTVRDVRPGALCVTETASREEGARRLATLKQGVLT
jgi:hypothetical protein